MLNIGNHEYDHDRGGDKDPSGAPGEGFHPWYSSGNYHVDSGGECGVPMYYRFHMPDNGHGLWWLVILNNCSYIFLQIYLCYTSTLF